MQEIFKNLNMNGNQNNNLKGKINEIWSMLDDLS